MFATFGKMKILAVAAVAATGLAAGAQTASAHDRFNFGFSFGLPVFAAPAPVYAVPAPVYAAPAPVIIAPPPAVVYAQPAPVVVVPAPPVYYHGYYGWGRGWHR